MLNLYKSGHCSNYLHLYLHSFQYITWQFILQLYQLLHERTRVSFHALSNSSYICIATSKGKRPRNERIEIFYDSGGRTIARFPLLLSVWNSRKKPRKWRVKRSSPHGIFAKRCLHYVYLPLSRRPSSRYYIVSKRICNRRLPSFGLRSQMLKAVRQTDLSPTFRIFHSFISTSNG